MYTDTLAPGILRLLLVSLSLFPLAASAAWPEKPIRIIIPWPPGGSTDIVGRLVAPELDARMKQRVIIDNRAGAASLIGMQMTASSPPDGYTLMLTSTAYSHLITKSNVDLVKSFDPVAFLGFGESALVVHSSLPVKSVKELIALAKARPGELNYASSGVGGFPHMTTELFKLRTGVSMVHVPFKGGGPALADVIAGHTQIYLGTLVTVMPYINSGRVRLLGLGSLKRNPHLPNVPTISESGVPGYEAYLWWGMFAPTGTPAAVISRIHAEITAILEAPELVRRFAEQGAVSTNMSSAEFGKLMVSETAKWSDVIKAAGIKDE